MKILITQYDFSYDLLDHYPIIISYRLYELGCDLYITYYMNGGAFCKILGSITLDFHNYENHCVFL
jgi:hypothetical protein